MARRFGRATTYLLIYDGRSYDSKAIAGVAYKLATGVPLGAHDVEARDLRGSDGGQ